MPRTLVSPVGLHVFVGPGLVKGALAYARDVGAEALQVFVANPRGWAQTAGDPSQDALFVSGCRESSLPVYVHAPYLINLGSPTALTVDRSIESIRHSVRRGRAICAKGVVVHAGTAVSGSGAAGGGGYDVAMKQVRERLRPVLDELGDDDPDLLVELTAGARGALAATPAQLDAYLDALDRHPKVGVCVDTCHAMAAGHDLAAPGGLRSFLSAVAKVAGRGRLRLVHANDSKDPAGSGRDRHERVGAGTIGLDTFGELFVHPATKGVPILLETAGEPADHRHDLDLLKRLRHDALAR